MKKRKKVLITLAVVIFGLVIIIGALTMEALRSYKAVRKMEAEVAATQQFVDKDKYVYFNLFLDYEEGPDDGVYILDDKEPQKVATIHEGEEGEFKLSTYREKFKESTKLVYELENLCSKMKESENGNVSIKIYNDLYMNGVVYYEVLLGRFDVSISDDFSIKLEFDDKVEVIKVGETYKAKFKCRFYGNEAKFILELRNYGALKKSESNFNVENWGEYLYNQN